MVIYDNTQLHSAMAGFDCISLQDMSNVRLMNRMDTKYVTTIDNVLSVLPQMKNYYLAQRVCDTALSHYRTLYYDTSDYAMYLEHHNKHYPRQKIRVRQYVESNQFFLELKNKTNKSRTRKERIQVSSLDISQDKRAKDFVDTHSRYFFSEISPSLDDSFIRITFANKSLTERITMDMFISFYNPRTLLDYNIDKYAVIELKQDKQQYSLAKELFVENQIRKSKFSKACIGQALTNPDIKHNLFKEQLHKLTQ